MSDHKQHHILSTRLALTIGAVLLSLTGFTVYIAHFDFGRWNLIVALLVAVTKAMLVCLFFMNLLYDKKENSLIFATSFFFLAIFFTLLATDVFFRGPVKLAKGQALYLVATGAQAKPKFKRPWVATPELVARGKKVFTQNCASCHGDQGLGNGPASASINPKPRNFTQNDDWKKGRKVTDIFRTLTNGLNQMPSFASLSPEDKWAAAHYVQTFGAKAAEPAPADFALIKIDPNSEFGGAAATVKSIPIDVAIELVVRDAQRKN